MNFEKLLEENKIKEVTKTELDLSLAERDLVVALHNFEAEDFDWALSIVYNAVLQACRALMFSLGFRPVGKNQHKTVFEFIELVGLNKDLINFFNAVRKTRHVAVYDSSGVVSESLANETLSKAKEFVQEIRTLVHKNRTLGEVPN